MQVLNFTKMENIYTYHIYVEKKYKDSDTQKQSVKLFLTDLSGQTVNFFMELKQLQKLTSN
jgi:hypothetical protein